ncbi:MAG TPA: ankyrin repeat domain-containing protein [Patescibacteria group bacterium]|nr:ankyrin repeat domain-containing protein [Patescibacteria group bacterium]
MGSNVLNKNLLNAAIKGDTDSVEEMASEGALVDAADGNGRTGLWHAARSGDSDMVQVLLKLGADTGEADNDGLTPLVAAIQNLNWRVAKQLIEMGDINHQMGETHFTALHAAVNLDLRDENTNRVTFLMKAGANALIADSTGTTALARAQEHAKKWPFAKELVELIEEFKDGPAAREKYLADKRDRGIVSEMQGTVAAVPAPATARFRRPQP